MDIEDDSNLGQHHSSHPASQKRDGGSPLSDVGSLSDSDLIQNGSRLHSLHSLATGGAGVGGVANNKPRIWSIVDTATNSSNSNNNNSSSQHSASLSPGGKSSTSSLGPISPVAMNRAAHLEYLASPYAKPGAMPNWYSAAAAAAAFAQAPTGPFPSLYSCPPALMSQLIAANNGVGPGATPLHQLPPHLVAAAAESSLNRLRSAAAVAAAAAAANQNSCNK